MDYKHSAFYFGHIVRSESCKIPFKEEDGVERVATLSLGAYTASEYAVEASRVMTEAGTQVYTVTFDRLTRLIEISAENPFQLLFGSSIDAGSSIKGTAGFEDADTGMLLSHVGSSVSGLAYFPQAPLNKYTPFEHWRGSSDAAINTSASGKTTIISFGEVQRMRCNISAITNSYFPETSVIKNNPTAKEEALAFMNFITKKNPVEFMFDKDQPEVFTKCILESTKDSKSGTSFELYEGLGKGLRNIYETDILVFRRID